MSEATDPTAAIPGATAPRSRTFKLPDLSRIPREVLILGGLITAAIGVAYFNGLGNLLKRWGEQQELSHGYFLPLIAGWMLWTRRSALLASLSKPRVLGLVGVGVASILVVLSELTVTSLMIFQQLALILLFASLALAIGGRGFFKLALVPIAFLLFMVPPPYWVITVLSWKFQFWSSTLGVLMIKPLGIPVFLSGNVIDLGDYQLQVAEACSGLRYLFPFLSLGFLAAYMFKAPLWQRAIVFLSTIPITIFMNSLRIAVTAILVQQFGTSHAEGFLHMFEGWVVFLFCLAFLFGVIALIARLSGRKQFGELLAMPEIEPLPAKDVWSAGAARRNALIALALIGASAAASLFVHRDNLLSPPRQMLAGLPSLMEGWRYEMRPLFGNTDMESDSDDYVLADFAHPRGDQVNLYIAYLNMQRDGHSWHSPRQCIPGGGWKIESHTIEPATTVDGRRYHLNRLLIENRGHRQLVYYWYDQRSRKMANELVMKSMLILDALRLRRTDGAMIRVITQVDPKQGVEAADARLKAFIAEMEPKLPAFVPPADVAMNDVSGASGAEASR
jgi:exosortase D (VPLPA-CTERM-specific)